MLTKTLLFVRKHLPEIFGQALATIRPQLGRAQSGVTLIELVVVISLVGIIGSFVVFRMDSLLAWRTESEIRRFTHTLQLVRNDSIQRQERYRVQINLDTQSYFVRREVPLDPGEIQQRDLLEGLRTKGQKERLEKKAEEELKSLEEEFAELDAREGGELEKLYYQSVFSDPEANVRLGVPTNFPSLAKSKTFDSALRIRDIEIGGKVLEEGTIVLRFLSRAPAPQALIHFQGADESQIYTVAIHPQSQNLRIIAGDVNFEDAFKTLTYEDDNAS